MALTYQTMKEAVKAVIAAGNVPNIVGEAGIGKSALVTEVAHDLHAQLFTTVVSLAEKGDLAIPVPPLRDEAFIQSTRYGTLANVQYGYSETLIQIIQQAEREPGKPIIWFLDEFNRGTSAVQSELMNLVLQRQVNSLQLPSEVRIVIAENPDDSMAGFANADYSVTPADAAIKDRTVRLVLTTSLTDWLTWAQTLRADGQPQINPVVQRYLREHPQQLNGPQNEDLYPTPRAWERVSTNLTELLKLDQSTQRQLMPDVFSGDLGNEVGVSFAEFVLNQGTALTVDDLAANDVLDQFKQLNDADQVQLLSKLVTQEADRLTNEELLKRVLEYLETVSPDGQYAVIQSFAKAVHDHPTLLEQIYEHASAGQTTFREFYQLVQKVAVM